MIKNPDTEADALQTVLAYHAASKHAFQRFADGPGYLDWATQPDPFRRYDGAKIIALETFSSAATDSAMDEPRYDDIFFPNRMANAPLDARAIARFFFDSMAISAWKVSGNSRWALRVNPSSGNLHPTEAYLICGAVEGLSAKPMVCHYQPREHALEVLAEFDTALWKNLCADFPEHTVFVALTSIHWREAWKYGLRGYRYCQHDVGHAMAAVSMAAAGLGWQTKILDDLGTEELAWLTGTFRAHHIAHNVSYNAEREEPDMLLALYPNQQAMRQTTLPEEALRAFHALAWHGQPNSLSSSHVDWGIENIAAAAKKNRTKNVHAEWGNFSQPMPSETHPLALRKMIRQRRSAVAMDGVTHITRDTFFRILQKTLPVSGAAPFHALPWRSHIHLAIFVHRVTGLPAGLYFLVRDAAQQPALAAACSSSHLWQKPAGCPEALALYCLIEADAKNAAEQISCGQQIASDGCFSLGMIAEFQRPLQQYGAWFYPRLFWEAGVIGQVLYLEAEAAGIRGTGIGCYFDNPMHDILGLTDNQYQDLYHFTVGGSVEDVRLVE